jgi:hypothetical protein
MEQIESVTALDDYRLRVTFSRGCARMFDCRKYLECEAFAELKEIALFRQVRNGGYFIFWSNGADLSADTLYLEGSEDDKFIVSRNEAGLSHETSSLFP